MEQTGKAFLRSSRHAALLALCYFAAVMIPNCILFFTEPYSIWSKAALLTLPAGGYLLWSVAFRRSGIAVWLSFPVIFFCALQIVLLYLFGNSVAATDMFINIVTTNPGEATELLSNIYPSVILVCVIYLPLLWTATVHVRRKVDFSPRFRRRTAVVGGVLALVGAGLLIPAYQTKRHVLRNEIFPVNVAYNVVLCAREYVKIENYDRTSAGFRYHARRTAKADKREIYVYVIGEASRAANWELYGYDRPTNPRLKALGDEIVVFRNMLTQSNTTHKSVPMILSSVRTNEHDELFRRKGLPALFNEAGFRTWFLSNQSPQGAMIDKLARDADSLIYMGHPRYDMQLLDTMKRIVEADTENDLLFILHCYGSHFSYHQRYPREAALFSARRRRGHRTAAQAEDLERLRQFDPLYRHLSVVGDRVSRIARCVQRIALQRRPRRGHARRRSGTFPTRLAYDDLLAAARRFAGVVFGGLQAGVSPTGGRCRQP